ncbi:MAG: methionine--tRNA ligase [Candidatus Diapherotrites archaeon]
MAGKNGFYITTAIDYPNSVPHLGHAYEKICADTIARWHRFKGEKVFFLTGTDEHGQKVEKAAKEAKLPTQKFVDLQVESFKKLVKVLNISNDRFIRTTEKRHGEISQEFFKKSLDKGDIYKGQYEGLYCTGCEAFYLEKDLAEGKCPIHKTVPELLKEESYFFRLSKYQKQLLEFYEKNPNFILPKTRRQEIINRVKEGLKDLSVSRTSFTWGIPLPNDSKHFLYVWYDALLNYVSGVDFPEKKFKEFWPADIHLIGKDILWFHSCIFPAMLFSAGIEPPRSVFVHGFINLGGEKLSKSSGLVVDPIKLAEQYGTDALRYFLLREIPFGEDGNFSEESLRERINNELANELGNLLNRSIVLLEKKCAGKIPSAKTDDALQKKLNLKKIEVHLDALELHLALAEIMAFVKSCNVFVNEKEPWKLEGKAAEAVLYSLADSLRIIANLLSPFIPETAEKIAGQLGCKLGALDECKFNLLRAGLSTRKGEVLFKKI